MMFEKYIMKSLVYNNFILKKSLVETKMKVSY